MYKHDHSRFTTQNLMDPKNWSTVVSYLGETCWKPELSLSFHTGESWKPERSSFLS